MGSRTFRIELEGAAERDHRLFSSSPALEKMPQVAVVGSHEAIEAQRFAEARLRRLELAGACLRYAELVMEGGIAAIQGGRPLEALGRLGEASIEEEKPFIAAFMLGWAGMKAVILSCDGTFSRGVARTASSACGVISTTPAHSTCPRVAASARAASGEIVFSPGR